MNYPWSCLANTDEFCPFLFPKGPAPDLTSYGLAIAACGFAGDVESCVGLLSEMLRRGMTPTLADYHGSLRACAMRRRLGLR